jgi:HK97 family phage portal protein
MFLGIKKSLTAVDGRESLRHTIWESTPGTWQQHSPIDYDRVTSHAAVFACMTLIASDISKLRIKRVKIDGDGIWSEKMSHEYSALFRNPNRYQNAIQFKENWMLSKLSRGTTYVLKERDYRNRGVALYIVDPERVTPLVSEVGGDVFYRLDDDNLSQIDEQVVVPAREIIHDRMNCLFHPLVGLSPIYAGGAAATQGLAAQTNSTRFFTNMSRPSGILTAPGIISPDTAARLKEGWEANYTGTNYGKVAVLGDGLSYSPIAVTAVDSQMLEQLRWTDEVVCSTFHVPPFKIGIGQMPTYQNADVLNQIYYSDCLQSLIEQFEACIDDGLGFEDGDGVELDLDGLMRMDEANLVKTLSEGIKGSLYTPDEARRRANLRPVPGGGTIYMQQQNWSLEQLDRRDIVADAPSVAAPEPEPDDTTERFAIALSKSFQEAG